MLSNKYQSKEEHWKAVEQLVEKWLHERQELILLMCAVDGLKEYTPKDTPVTIKIQAFCQVLVDYASAGHFEIYEELMYEAEDFEEQYNTIIEKVMPRIQDITDEFLDFNDNYANDELCSKKLKELPDDLSRIGELLEERFELEDQMIDTLHNSHRSLVA